MLTSFLRVSMLVFLRLWLVLRLCVSTVQSDESLKTYTNNPHSRRLILGTIVSSQPPPQDHPNKITPQGYGVGKQLVESFSTVKDGQYSVAQVSAAGFFSAIPMTVITAPFERVKVLLQLQGQKQLAPGEKPKYAGGTDVVRQLYKEGGIRSVYRGSVMTLARDGPGSAAYFATYETIKRRLTPKDENGKPGELSILAVMAAGGAAGVAMWIPVFPVDTIKSRLQSAEGNPTISGTIRQLYGRGGLGAFFPGIAPAMARAVPANAATFLGVELAHQALNKMLG